MVGLTWTVITCIDRNGVITYYAVKFQRQDEPMNSETMIVDSLMFTATDLTPATTYTFQVAGVNINGTGPFNTPMTVTTEEARESDFYFT